MLRKTENALTGKLTTVYDEIQDAIRTRGTDERIKLALLAKEVQNLNTTVKDFYEVTPAPQCKTRRTT